MRDLSGLNQKNDWATFLPAISSFYTSTLGRQKINSNYHAQSRIPSGFENGLEGMNFFNEDKGYFYYDSALYSAGHAVLDLNKNQDLDYMIYSRSKGKTALVGDSGGFQIGKGVIKFDWENFFEKKGDANYKGKADQTRLSILRWLEATADWSMTLDVPGWACEGKNREMTGLNSFDECMKATIHNNEFFENNRVPGKTKFLNVLQGSNDENADIWYEAVKNHNFEGWALGGAHTTDLAFALRRIIIMRDEGMFEGKDWLHTLGTSKLDWACGLTSIQRQIKKINPNFRLSFDCASPFIATAKGLIYYMNSFENKRFSYLMCPFVDDKSFKGSITPLPFDSEIAKRLNMGDICTYGPTDTNRLGKVGKSSWDTLSYAMMMSHNTYMHIRAVQNANALMDIESKKLGVDYRDWKRTKRNDKSGEISEFVPQKVLYFNSFVEELFASDKPMSMLNDAKLLLKEFSSDKRSTNQIFGNLFSEEATGIIEDSGFDENDTALDDMERDIING